MENFKEKEKGMMIGKVTTILSLLNNGWLS